MGSSGHGNQGDGRKPGAWRDLFPLDPTYNRVTSDYVPNWRVSWSFPQFWICPRTPRGDFCAVLEVCGRMGVQQHAWLGQAIGWHFWCVRRWGFTSQSRSFLWFSWETLESQYGFKLFEDHQPPCFFFVFWRSCFQTFSDQSQLMADLGPGSTGRMARSMRATITKTWRQHLQHTKSVLFGFQFGLLRYPKSMKISGRLWSLFPAAVSKCN